MSKTLYKCSYSIRGGNELLFSSNSKQGAIFLFNKTSMFYPELDIYAQN